MAHTEEPKREITVVAAVIRDAEGRVLLTQRPKGRHMGGLWEFPGGKINREEHPAEALFRELDEELGIKTAVGEPITFAIHEEHDLRILLLFFRAHILEGSPRGCEGQSLRWVAVSDLPSYRTPPADARLVRLLGGDEAP